MSGKSAIGGCPFNVGTGDGMPPRKVPTAAEECRLFLLPVSTSIMPCGLIRTRATDRPAAFTALTARVTTCWRNVDGPRDIQAPAIVSWADWTSVGRILLTCRENASNMPKLPKSLIIRYLAWALRAAVGNRGALGGLGVVFGDIAKITRRPPNP